MEEFDLILIDSGINSKKFIKQEFINLNLFECSNNQVIRVDQMVDSFGHGDSVLALFIEQFRMHNQEKQKLNIAIFKLNNNDYKTIDLTLKYLNFIYKNMKSKIIQMSFGIRGYSLDLENICKKIVENKTLIISSFDNFGAISYPAGFNCVIGVKGNKLLKNNEFIVHENGIVDIEARIYNSYNEINKFESNNFGNSFSSSYVTCKLLYEIIIKNKKIQNKQEALQVFEIKEYKENNNVISFSKNKTNRIAIFPLNKENYNLINFDNLLIGKLTKVYDIKYNNKINSIIQSFNKTKYIVENYNEMDFNEFDTLVIGHTNEISLLLKKNIKRELLFKCLNFKKNVYSYDGEEISDIMKNMFYQNNNYIYIANEAKHFDTLGHLYQNKTPIISIIGTSPYQGKFTLQLQIYKLLKERNIDVGFLGTEPNALLFGADEIFSYGYNSKKIKEYNENQFAEILNQKIHNIDIKNKNIIITGAQSSFLPNPINGMYNSNYMWCRQFSFLFGVNPDGVILVVNTSDSFDFIRKNIIAIESLIKTKVFMIALYKYNRHTENIIPNLRTKNTTQDLELYIKKLEEHFNIPGIIIGDDDYDKLIYNQICKYFSRGTK